MDSWLARFRGSLAMGLTWGFAGVAVGALIEVFVDPSRAVVDFWPLVLGVPAFLGGTGFSVLVTAVASQRRLDDLSSGRIAAWGALGGLIAGLVPRAMFGSGSEYLIYPAENVWVTTTVLGLSLSVMTAATAVGVLALARMGQGRTLSDSARAATDGEGTPVERRDPSRV